MSITTTKEVSRQCHSSTVERAFVVTVTPVLALAVWAVSHLVLGVDLIVGSGSSERSVGVVDVVLTTLLASCAGWGVMGLIERRRGRSRRPWTVVAVVVLLLSLLGPLGAASVGAGLALLCLHLLVGLTIILGLRRTSC